MPESILETGNGRKNNAPRDQHHQVVLLVHAVPAHVDVVARIHRILDQRKDKKSTQKRHQPAENHRRREKKGAAHREMSDPVNHFGAGGHVALNYV